MRDSWGIGILTYIHQIKGSGELLEKLQTDYTGKFNLRNMGGNNSRQNYAIYESTYRRNAMFL